LVQCETGLVSLTGTPDEVAKVGVSIADIAAGMYAFSGTLAALYHCAVTGEGSTIEVSLFEALAEWVGQPAHFTAGAGRQPGRFGAQHATIAPYGPFEAGDGRTVLIAIQNEPEWARFCTVVLERPEVAEDPRFASSTLRVAHRAEVNSTIEKVFTTLTTPLLEARLTAARIAFGGVNTVSEFLEHPVLQGRERWRTVATETGPVLALLPPIDLGAEARMDPVPSLGDHTSAILAELGHDPLEFTGSGQPQHESRS
jgi:itaconate CoA-transferase